MFVGLHVLLAERMDAPELMLSPDEGKDFMGAVQNVMRHYSVETTQKTLDWLALMGTATGMYVPRIAAISMRRRGSRGATPRRPAPSASNGTAHSPAPTALDIQPDMTSDGGFRESEH